MWINVSTQCIPMQIKKTKIIIFSCFLLFILGAVFFVGGNLAWAQDADVGINYAANVGLPGAGDKDVRVFMVEIIRYFIGFLGIIAVIMVMYAGFLWMTSNGEPDKITRAKRTLINSIIGLIIIISAFAIVTFIINFMDGGGGAGGKCKKPVDI